MNDELIDRLARDAAWLEARGITISSIRQARLALKVAQPPADRLVEAKELLERVDTLLAEWLTDNTEEVFEEEPQIDDARGDIQEVILEIERRIAK